MSEGRRALAVFADVFSRPTYFLIAAVIAAVTFAGTVLVQNLGLLVSVWGTAHISLVTKVTLVWNLFGGIATNYSIASAVTIVLLALLVGINIALAVFLISKSRGISSTAAGSMSGGLFAGLLGIGCAACGSFLITTFLPLLGTAVVAGYLPLHGAEFGIIGVLLMAVSVVLVVRQIERSGVCDIE